MLRREPPSRRVSRLAATVSVLASVLLFSGLEASGAVAAPAGLPGPPPTAGQGFPLPPPPGQGPPGQPLGPPVTLPYATSRPGLLSGYAPLRGNRIKLQIACGSGGRAGLSVPAVTSRTLASSRYKCSGRRGTLAFTLAKPVAREIGRAGNVLARIAFKTGRVSLTVGPRVPATDVWTSFYGLRCNTPTPAQGQLTAPNFTATPRAITIDVRPWLVWYTSATGWQWLGTGGPGVSRWYRWTATPNGVAEWQPPSRPISPWMWSPITVSPGRGTYVVAVFEAIYWYSRPAYVWRYARSGPSAQTNTTYCAYP
jgi:hypothetical protein